MKWTKDGSWWRSEDGRFTLMPHWFRRGVWCVMYHGEWVQMSQGQRAAKSAAERHARKLDRQGKPLIEVS